MPHVLQLCSVSGCVNGDVVDLELNGKHNIFGVANNPETLWQLVRAGKIDASDAQLFYYEAYEQEMEADGWLSSPAEWQDLSPVPRGKVAAIPARVPAKADLLGYDVITCEDYLDHSPLACNSIAETLAVNEHCLFSTLDQAVKAIEAGGFEKGEPGVYKIYSVYLVHEA